MWLLDFHRVVSARKPCAHRNLPGTVRLQLSQLACVKASGSCHSSAGRMSLVVKRNALVSGSCLGSSISIRRCSIIITCWLTWSIDYRYWSSRGSSSCSCPVTAACLWDYPNSREHHKTELESMLSWNHDCTEGLVHTLHLQVPAPTDQVQGAYGESWAQGLYQSRAMFTDVAFEVRPSMGSSSKVSLRWLCRCPRKPNHVHTWQWSLSYMASLLCLGVWTSLARRVRVQWLSACGSNVLSDCVDAVLIFAVLELVLACWRHLQIARVWR